MPWPTGEWPLGPLPDGVDLDGLIAEAFDPDGPLHQTYAVVDRPPRSTGLRALRRIASAVGQARASRSCRRPPCCRGRWPSRCCTRSSACWWTKGGSLLDGPAPVPLWSDADDPRRRDHPAATLGDARRARLSRGVRGPRALRHPPDAVRDGADRTWRPSPPIDRWPCLRAPGSTTRPAPATSISGIVARHGRTMESPTGTSCADRLFGPLGMTSATVTFDDVGTWVGRLLRLRHRPRLCPVRSALPPRRRLGRSQAAPRGMGGPRTPAPIGRPRRRRLLRLALVDAARTRSAPFGPPVTRASTSTSARTSISFWSGWVGPRPTTREDVKQWRTRVIEASHVDPRRLAGLPETDIPPALDYAASPTARPGPGPTR